MTKLQPLLPDGSPEANTADHARRREAHTGGVREYDATWPDAF